MTPKTGPNVEKNFVDVIFSSKSTYEPIFTKIGVVDRNWTTKGLSHFLMPALLTVLMFRNPKVVEGTAESVEFETNIYRIPQ